MGRVTDRLFWTEEGQAKTDGRFRRERERIAAERETSANTHVDRRVTKNLLSLTLTLAIGVAVDSLCHRLASIGDEISELIASPAALLFLAWLRARRFYSISWRENPDRS